MRFPNEHIAFEQVKGASVFVRVGAYNFVNMTKH